MKLIIKRYFKKLKRWFWKEFFKKETLFCLIIAEIIFWSPSVILGIMALTISPYFWGAFGVITAFWALPLTPAIPLQIGLAFLIRKLYDRRKAKRGRVSLQVGKNTTDN